MDWTAVVPVLSFAAGAMAQLGGEALRDRRLVAREERAAARVQAREDQQAARDFERETLLELQEAVHGYARCVGRAHHEAHLHIRRDGGNPRSVVLSDGLDEELRLTGVDLDRLRARVASAEVAGWLGRMKKDALEAVSIGIGDRDLAHADEHMEAFATEVEDVHRAIGDRLRELIYGSAVLR